MTPDELRLALARARYPDTFVVDHVTLESAEHAVLAWIDEQPEDRVLRIGPHGGLMFKGVELLLPKGDCPGKISP